MGVTAAAGGTAAYGQYQAGVAENKYYNYLADASEQEGDLAVKLGQKQSEFAQDSAKAQGRQFKSQAAQFASSQRAALAANGIDLSSVTAQDIVSSSFGKEKLDEMAIRYNADAKSWEIENEAKYKKWSSGVQAEQYRYAGKMKKSAAKMQAITTLLGTAASVAMIGASGLGKAGTTTPGGGGTGSFQLSGSQGSARTTSFLVR